MSRHTVETEEVELDLVDVLDGIAATERGLWFVLIGGGGAVGGAANAAGAYIMSRCLLEAEAGRAFDAAGRFVPTPSPERAKGTPEARKVCARVQRALRAGRQAGAEFVLCFHVEGDPRWHLEWSDQHDLESAAEAVKQHLKSGVLWA
jgi:hypothetical protein